MKQKRNHKKTMLPRLISFLLLAALAAGLAGCGSAKQETAAAAETAAEAETDPEAAEKAISYVSSMDTYMTLTAYGSHRSEALAAGEEEILRLNDLFSIGVEDSEVAQINREGTGVFSEDTLNVLEGAREVYEMTGGLFDITITPLMELWGFTSGNYRVPSQEEIDAARQRMGEEAITVDAATGTVTLPDGCEIDLGGIAKGYTSQKVMEVFAECGVTSGIISLGGNIQCLGAKPDGSNWKVGIREPGGSETSYVAVLQVQDCAVITSGGYERYFVDEATGTTYCHILDPFTGYPVNSDLASVTIVSPDGMLADGLSTSLYLMGMEQATEFWRAHSDEFQVFFIDNDGNLYASEGLEGVVTPNGDMEITILRK